MIFVTGGFSSGKKEFVEKKLGFSLTEFTRNITEEKKVLYDLQRLNYDNWEELIPLLLKKEVVICDELGCGLLPLERNLREQQENVGRLCCKLAEESTAVYRVICGIGQKIK